MWQVSCLLCYPEIRNFPNTQIEQILYQTANDLGETGLDQYSGYGRVDAAEALEVAKVKVHDIAVNQIRVDPKVISSGEAANIVVTIQNQGTFVEKDVSLQLFVDSEMVNEQVSKIKIRPWETYRFTYNWMPQPIADKEIVIQAKLPAIKGEIDIEDNTRTLELIAKYDNGVLVVKHSSSPKHQTHQYLAGEAWQILPAGAMKTEIGQYIGNKVSYDIGLFGADVVSYSGRYNEDINRNSSLDAGEDVNGNGILDQAIIEPEGVWTPGGVGQMCHILGLTWVNIMLE